MRLPAVLFACTLALGAWAVNAGPVTGLPDGWTLGGEAPRLYTVDVLKDGGPSGHDVVELRRIEAAHPYGDAWLLKRLPPGAYAGKQVRLSMRVRFDGTERHGGTVYINHDDGTRPQLPGGAYYHPMPDGTGWTPFGATLSLPADLRHLDIGVALRGPGRAAVDMIALQVVGDAPPDQRGMTLTYKFDAEGHARAPE